MNLRLALTSTALLFLALAGSHPAIAEMITALSKITIDGKSYTVAIIEPEDELSKATISDAERRQAAEIRARAERWVTEQYQVFYKKAKLSDQFLNTRARGMQTSKPRSASLIVIMKDHDLNQIQATTEFVYPSSLNGKLPSEEEFGVHFPRTEPKMSPYISGRDLWKPNASELAVNRFSFNHFELKKFVTLQTAAPDRDWLPTLIQVAENGGLSDKSFAYNLQLNGVKLPAQIEIYPSEYNLSCDQSMVDYYKSKGLSVAIPDEVDGTRFLKISRAGWQGPFVNSFKDRGIAASISQMKWDHSVYFSPLVDCSELRPGFFGGDCSQNSAQSLFLRCLTNGMKFHRTSRLQNLLH